MVPIGIAKFEIGTGRRKEGERLNEYYKVRQQRNVATGLACCFALLLLFEMFRPDPYFVVVEEPVQSIQFEKGFPYETRTSFFRR